MTRAITYAAAGDPASVLEVAEIPDPPLPGPGQIQVDVRAFPIHPGDLVGVRFGPPHPGQRTVAGLEATGVVIVARPAVDTLPVGACVTVFPNPGSWAQRINVPAEIAVPVPDSVSDDVAAQMVCNPLTTLLLHRAAQQHFSADSTASLSTTPRTPRWLDYSPPAPTIVRSRRSASCAAPTAPTNLPPATRTCPSSPPRAPTGSARFATSPMAAPSPWR